jgi:hypothetical protein
MKKTLAGWLEEVDDKIEGNLLVYETEKPKVSDEMFYKLAKEFEIDGKIQSKDDISLVSQQEKKMGMYKKSGAFWYADFAKLHNPSYKPELPSENDARDIAIKYLTQKNRFPDNAVLDSTRRNVFERVEGDKRDRAEQPNNVTVDFRFSVNGLNTYGPGAKIKVYVGHDGEVIGLFHAMRQFREYAKFACLSKEDLEEILKRKLGLSLERIEVKDVKLAYHAESCVLNTRFVQPVYIFTLAASVKGKRGKGRATVEFLTHPLPATIFAPIVTIETDSSPMEIRQGEKLTLTCSMKGGTEPFSYSWESNIDGHLGNDSVLQTTGLSVARRDGRITSHTIKVTVTDGRGMQDSHQVLVKVHPGEQVTRFEKEKRQAVDPDDPYVGVEWCNIYHGTPGLADISGTDTSAQGFNNYIKSRKNWSSRFEWGNDNAWEEDFKFANAPGGGTDSDWSDAVDFAFFAGHGSLGAFYFGSTVDDHTMVAQDARWGDGRLKWIVLHACQTMQANFAWTVWDPVFKGLHQMFGFHTNTEGSTPPLGSRFAAWMAAFSPFFVFSMQTAWKQACTECFDSSVEYAVIYANQTGTDTSKDFLPGYGYVSPDPTSPSVWTYYKGSC